MFAVRNVAVENVAGYGSTTTRGARNLIIVNWKPNSNELRRWAVMTSVALACVGSLFYFVNWGVFAKAHGLAPILWGFGAFALLTAGTGTRIGLPAYWMWMTFVWIMGTLIGTVALAIVFFLVVTPLGLLARVMGRDKLLVRNSAAPSMWKPLPSKPHDPLRQF